MKKYGKFMTGPAHIFNDVPTNREEALQHGNAIAASGNMPVGTTDCFNVGISGGCGPNCFVYLEGRCEEPQEMIPRLATKKERQTHDKLYPQNKDDMNETWEEETLRLLNEGEHSEALKNFRQKHGMVNRCVCNDCGLISPHYSSNGCDKCGNHNVETRVVIDKPNTSVTDNKQKGGEG